MTLDEMNAFYAAEAAAEELNGSPMDRARVYSRWGDDLRARQTAERSARRNATVSRDAKRWSQSDIDDVAAVCAMLTTD
jgi:hypothetical protein